MASLPHPRLQNNLWLWALCVVCCLLLGSPLVAAPQSSIPAPELIAAELDALHGPCGNGEGLNRLSAALTGLIPENTTYPFQFQTALCLIATPFEPFSESEALFLWLPEYEHAPEAALEHLAHQLPLGSPIARSVRMAALHLMTQHPALQARLLPEFRQDPDPLIRRLADSIANQTWPDPWTRGLGLQSDYTGALYEAIFMELGLWAGCVCPSKPRGTPLEQDFCRVFLALHPRDFPTRPQDQAKHPWLAPWLAAWHNPDLPPLQRTAAGMVIWRLTSDSARSNS